MVGCEADGRRLALDDTDGDDQGCQPEGQDDRIPKLDPGLQLDGRRPREARRKT